ncbi:MAG: hypothetical protein R2854_18925 [Caldilineaceae bacterium]
MIEHQRSTSPHRSLERELVELKARARTVDIGGDADETMVAERR